MDLQAEFFAEDVHPPAGAEGWTDDALRAFFESGGDLAADGAPSALDVSDGLDNSPPWSVATNWALPAAETRHALTDAEIACERDRQLGHTVEATPPVSFSASGDADAVPSPPRPTGAVVGSLPLKWQTYEVDFEYSATTTVADLKQWLEAVTTVPRARQKLLGWSPQLKRAAERDDARLEELTLGPRTSRLMLMGTPIDAHRAAELDLERGKRTSRFVANDLRGPPPPPPRADRSFGAPKRTTPQAIHANRGGGIFLDPHVWAQSEEDEAAMRRARGRDRHVLNPATNRVEALGLGNALVAEADRMPGGAADDVEEAMAARHAREGPVNVDLLGTARGACRGCTRCDGYERQERGAENQNDVDVLNCRRCGCGAHLHDAI